MSLGSRGAFPLRCPLYLASPGEETIAAEVKETHPPFYLRGLTETGNQQVTDPGNEADLRVLTETGNGRVAAGYAQTATFRNRRR